MVRRLLKNKPLIEAMFELRWNLRQPAPGIMLDPHYRLLIGRLYEKLYLEYPFHEQLPTATMPDEIAGYVVQDRFRKNEGKWPLLQVGPGIITVNDTEEYIWEDFKKRIVQSVGILFDLYPESATNLKVNELMLRYVDAVPFDFENDNILQFLQEQLKIRIDLYQGLFEDTGTKKLPLGLDLRFSFASSEPKGAIRLRFARGKRRGSEALIWETVVQSVSKDEVPQLPSGIADWVENAHNITDDWFFKLIEGELLRRFE